MDKLNFKIKGQSLVEIIVAIAVAGVLIGGTTMLISVVLQESKQIKITNAADNLAQEYLDKLQSISEGDWHKIYCLPTVSNCLVITDKEKYAYYLNSSNNVTNSGVLVVNVGTQYASLDLKEIETTGGTGLTKFYRYFIVENVNRGADTSGDIVTTGGYDDPSTQKITAVVLRDNGAEVIRKSQYLTRHRNIIFNQTDWSGGPGQTDFPPINPPEKIGTIINNRFDSIVSNLDPNNEGIDYSVVGEIKIAF